MPTAKLTDRLITTLPLPERRTEYWDTLVSGLCLRHSPQGQKVFYLRYRNGATRRRLKLGPYPAITLADARSNARTFSAAVTLGQDPQAERLERRQAETFAELAKEYLEIHAKRKKRSWPEDERQIRKDLLPFWGRLKAKEISRRDVLVRLESIVDRGAPIVANRTRALINKIFNFGISRGIVDANPAYMVEPPAREVSRERVLTEREIAAVWHATEQLHPIVAAAYRLRLLTAQRSIEVRSMRWSDLDGDWWIIPGEVAKNRQQHRVPISTQTRAVIEDLRPHSGASDWVLASPRKPEVHLGALQKATGRLREASGVDFVPHDLRRTAASLMTSMGIQRLTVAKILNHAEPGVTKIYDRYSYDREKMEALEMWGRRVEEIVAAAPPE